MWEMDSRKCDGGQFFLKKNWETARVSNFHHLIIF